MGLLNKTGQWKFIRKWMLLAKTIAEQNDSCYSRQIGTVIVNPKNNSLISAGYNGPAKGTPHCDSYEFLKDFFWPQLTIKEKISLINKTFPGNQLSYSNVNNEDVDSYCEIVTTYYSDCQTCPRRLINAGSGQRSELCSCLHSEQNALTQCSISPVGCVMYCWCGVLPCIQCAGSIINAGIDNVYCLKSPDYHSVSRFLFEKSHCSLYEIEEEKFSS